MRAYHKQGMRILTLGSIVGLAVVLAACTTTGSSTPTGPSASGINAFTGTWTSTSAVSTSACSGVTYTVTPTGTRTANVSYTATCAGVAVKGTGSGTLNDDSTLNWTTGGTAGVCPYSLTGTATPQGTSDLKVTYSGTVCSVPVSGTDVLHR